ncbi:uncharacterized protein LOC119179727 isoform X2 [Rhipicephalus microplus]|uniref:uncharacterized protein LOC119179727 isoform X2 n=1 Tax=Rhipicephalus microplus TaxID=6941 RepID=UPI003F6D7F4E
MRGMTLRESVTSARARFNLRRLKNAKDACLASLLASPAKRWLLILSLVMVFCLILMALSSDSVVRPPSLPFAVRGGATIAESSYGNEQGSRQSAPQSLDPKGSQTNEGAGTSSEATGKKYAKVWKKVRPTTRTTPAASATTTPPVALTSEPSVAEGVKSSTIAATRAVRAAVTPTKVAPRGALGTTVSIDVIGHMWMPHDTLHRGFGRVPFPLESVYVLPTAYKVVYDCRRGVDYLFFVHTAATHSDHRRVLREVVGNSTYGVRYKWTAVFFVGMSSVEKVTHSVAYEAEAYGDVVVLPYMDTYRNLTYKYVYGIKWTLENCPRVRYVLKIDDDIVVHLPSLMARLAGGDRPPQTGVALVTRPKLYCCVWDYMPVIRQTALPWYISEKAYPKNVFPRYCSGSAVFMDATTLAPLYNATFSVPYLPVDDAYVTGELAAVAGVEHESLNALYSFDYKRWPSVINGSVMVVQVYDAATRSSAWKSVAEMLGRKPQQRRHVHTTPNIRNTRSVTARSVGARVTTSRGPATTKSLPEAGTNSSRPSS